MSEKKFKVSGHSTTQCQGVINYAVAGLTGNYPDIKFKVTVKAGWYSYVAGHGIAYNGSKFKWDSSSQDETKTANVNWRSSGAGYSPYFGAKTFEFDLGKGRSAIRGISLGVTTYAPYNFSGSITATSASIPAPSSYKLSISNITEKSVVVSHTLGNQRGYWRVRLKDNNSGATWSLNSNTGNGSTTISGLSPNTAYAFVVQVLDRNDKVCYASDEAEVKTLGISKVGNSPSFVLGDAFALAITGYSDSFTHTAVFKVGDYSFTRTGLKRGNVTITPTADEVDEMYAQFATKDAKSMNITLTTYVTGASIGSATGSGAVSLNVTVARPVVVGFDYEDIVATAISLTGNIKHVIQDVSQVRVSNISATGQKGATIKSYQLIVGNRTIGSASTTITDTGTVASNSGITVKAIDSRGLEGVKTIPFVGFYSYTAPKLTALNARRRNSIEASTYLKMGGSWTPLTTDGAKKNNSCSVAWCYKKTSESSYGAYVGVKTFADGTINYDNIVGNLDPESSFNIRVRLQDALSATTFDCLLGKGTPDFSVCKNGAAFGKIAETPNQLDVVWPIMCKGVVMANPGYFVASKNQGLRVLNSAGSPVEVIYMSEAGMTILPNNHVRILNTLIIDGGLQTGNYSIYHDKNDGCLYALVGSYKSKLLTDSGNMACGGDLYLDKFGNSRAISTKWADGDHWAMVSIASDNLTSYLGPGSMGQNTVTNLRGKYVKLYNHAGGYCQVNGAAITSDRNLKYDISNLDGLDVFYDSLTPRRFKYKTGTAKRFHFGFVVQEVEEALELAGLTTNDFAGVIIDKDITRSEDDTDSNYLLDNGIKEMHLLRMEEFISLNTRMIQKARRTIESQGKLIEQLLARVDSLEQKTLERE